MLRQINFDKEMRTRSNSKPVKSSSLTSGKKGSPVIMPNKGLKLGTGSTRIETPTSSRKSNFTVRNNTPTSFLKKGMSFGSDNTKNEPARR